MGLGESGMLCTNEDEREKRGKRFFRAFGRVPNCWGAIRRGIQPPVSEDCAPWAPVNASGLVAVPVVGGNWGSGLLLGSAMPPSGAPAAPFGANGTVRAPWPTFPPSFA